MTIPKYLGEWKNSKSPLKEFPITEHVGIGVLTIQRVAEFAPFKITGSGTKKEIKFTSISFNLSTDYT